MPKVHACIAALTLFLLPACAEAQPARFDADAVAADVTEWEDWLFATHPQPEFSMDVERVRARFGALRDGLRDGLNEDYTRREAWLSLALLNPYFADGHVTVRLPVEDYEAWLADGGAAFTLPVRLEGHQLRVAETVAESSRARAGEIITAINDQAVGPLIEAALARTNGDTPGLRRHVVETRFARYLWALTGGAMDWQVTLRDDQGAIRTLTLDPEREQAGRDAEHWSLDVQDEAAILTLNTFAPNLQNEFNAFIDASFADIAARGSDVLVIDISQNGGGAHMLSDHLLAYLTDQRHTPLSAVTARITPENQARIPGSALGQVISMPFAQWVEPPAELANRFDGRFAFLVGAGTYSQAIVLAATVQDFDIAPVAGPGTEGRANSTGQVQLHRLANTDLEVAAPIYVFTRASGDTSSAAIVPDIPLNGSREHQITALIALLQTGD
ncbi:S41 family peptidase [Maricaulis maris]|uniref:S41 family peptidase n=1 Tax=Maricaulis maris TaxID=74318 RepID=UPI003B8C37DF